MPRISVSLPEELVARLAPVKARINVSQVCREALEHRLDSFERAAAQGADLDLEVLVDRLRSERELIEGKFEDLARRNGATWLSTASYLELKDVAETQSTTRMDRYRLPRAAFRVMRQDMEESKQGIEGPQAVVYKTAWLDYVRSVWSDVVQHLDDATIASGPASDADEGR